MPSIKEYFALLGLDESATVAQIKKAYRAKVKLYHPDINKAPDAEQKFIAYTEAYDVLLSLRTKPFSSATKGNRFYKTSKETQLNKRKEQARQRAEQYAKMRYEEFINSEYYIANKAVDLISDHLVFFITVFGVFILPIILIVWQGLPGAIISVVILLFLFRQAIDILKEYKNLDFSEFKRAWMIMAKYKPVNFTFFTVANILLFLKVGFETMIPTFVLLGIYPLAIVLTYFIIKKYKYKLQSIIVFCYAPTIVSLLLTLNFLFSFDPQTESYRLTHHNYRAYDEHGNYMGIRTSSYITLKDNVYEDYYGIRVFMDYSELQYKNCITYTFKTGILGIRVMKDYEFSCAGKE